MLLNNLENNELNKKIKEIVFSLLSTKYSYFKIINFTEFSIGFLANNNEFTIRILDQRIPIGHEIVCLDYIRNENISNLDEDIYQFGSLKIIEKSVTSKNKMIEITFYYPSILENIMNIIKYNFDEKYYFTDAEYSAIHDFNELFIENYQIAIKLFQSIYKENDDFIKKYNINIDKPKYLY